MEEFSRGQIKSMTEDRKRGGGSQKGWVCVYHMQGRLPIILNLGVFFLNNIEARKLKLSSKALIEKKSRTKINRQK